MGKYFNLIHDRSAGRISPRKIFPHISWFSLRPQPSCDIFTIHPPTCEFLKLNPEIWLKETLLSCHTQTIRSFVLTSISSLLFSSPFSPILQHFFCLSPFLSFTLSRCFFPFLLHYYNLSRFYLFSFFHFHDSLFFSASS